jgi:N-formylglutamate amidohydrolase
VDTFIITCEHGGNRIPAPYRRLFRGQRALLDSHRGYDPGSLVMSKALASAFAAPLVASTVSRLLIDLNRSIGHPQLFSTVTRAAPAQTRAQIVEQHYRPYRMQVERLIWQAVARGASRDPHFVAQLYRGAGWQGARRRCGFALPPRSAWGGRGVRPLEGNAGGIGSGTSRTPQLPLCRKRRRVNLALACALAQCHYVGIELEVNQGIVFAAGRRWTALRRMLIDSLRTACAA